MVDFPNKNGEKSSFFYVSYEMVVTHDIPMTSH